MENENRLPPPVWAGFDVAKKTFDAALYLPVDPGQQPREIKDLPKKSFSRTPEGVREFHHWSFQVREKAGIEGGSLRIVMEATGRYSSELTGWLNNEISFTKPAIENPKTVNAFINSLKIRNKTDPIDAGALARYGAERMPEAFEKLPEDYQYLREIVRQRIAIKDQLTAARLRMNEMSSFKKLAKIQQSVIDSLEKAVEKLELEIKSCVNNSEELKKSMEKAITIPGVALITAATVLGECGPLYHYKSRQLGSYSGLAPQIKQSGTSVRGCHISKFGPGNLRRVLYMASLVAMENNPRMKSLYTRLISNGKKPLQARCAVMHKLLILIRAVVVNGMEYNENYSQNPILNS